MEEEDVSMVDENGNDGEFDHVTCSSIDSLIA